MPKPFSSKQKKEQLQKKREKKRNTKESESDGESGNEKCVTTLDKNELKVKFINSKKLNEQPDKPQDPKSERNKFNLQFIRESYEELRQMKKNSYKPMEYHAAEELEIDIDDYYKPGSPLDMPLRPKWSYEMSKQQLEANETKYFDKYLDNIFQNFPHHELSYFEMNLETWRQLWRVLEICDIVLLIVDIRFPALHFSPTLYKHCLENDKDLILVLNKIDLVPTAQVVAWKTYFEEKFPKLHVLLFSSSKQIKFRRAKHQAKLGKNKQATDSKVYEDEEKEMAVKAAAAEIYTSRAHRQLFECVKEIVKTNVSLDSWDELTAQLVNESVLNKVNLDEKIDSEGTANDDEMQTMEEFINSREKRQKFENGYVTIGCCGFPNVGKSSLLNSLKGRKCVSVSKTPGHTKHLQTIFLTKNVRLCDCPGLVFPSLSKKPLQVLAGIYPIAQLQEPYSAIRFLAENTQMIELLKVKHPEAEEMKHEEISKDKVFDWSPLYICEAWANKRGYFTAKACRPDVYRAANELLRMALDGRLCISLKPRNYFKQIEFWKEHTETQKLNEVINSVELIVKEKLEKMDENTETGDFDSEEEDEDFNNFEKNVDSQTVEEDDDHSEEENNVASNPYALLDQQE